MSIMARIPRSGKTVSRGSFISSSAQHKQEQIHRQFSDFVVRLVKRTFTIILRVGVPHVHPGVRF